MLDKVLNRIVSNPPSQPDKPAQDEDTRNGPMYDAVTHLAEMS